MRFKLQWVRVPRLHQDSATRFRRRTVRLIASLWAAATAFGVNSAWAQTTAGPTPRIIIKWKQVQPLQNPQSRSAARTLSDAQARFAVGMTRQRVLATGGELLRLSRGMTPSEIQQMITHLNNDPAVEYAEPDQLLQPMVAVNDVGFARQWSHFEPQGGLSLPSAWLSSTGVGVRVAVVDTGIRPHSDLLDNIVGGYDFISDPFIANDGGGRDADPTDPGDFVPAGVCGPGAPATNSTWHGTHVAGIIAAVANNTIGIAGIAHGAKVVPIRAVGRCGALLSDVVDGAVWGAAGYVPSMAYVNPNPAKIVNIALAAPGPCSPTIQEAVNRIRGRGAVVVVAAGNGGVDAASVFPANCANVITVAATGRNGERAPYSNFGASVEIAAPGGDLSRGEESGVLSTFNAGTTTPSFDSIKALQGTSMATAHVSGALALTLSKHNLRLAQIESILLGNTRPFPVGCDGCGVGIVDPVATVRAADSIPLVALLRGGASQELSAGYAPYFISDSTGDIFESRLIRRNSKGVIAGEYKTTTPFLPTLPPFGCVGEQMVWTLTVVDGRGRTSSFSQTTTFVQDPAGGGIPQSCGH